MIEVNQRVKVLPTKGLAEMHLSGIVDRAGVVTEQVFGGSSNPIGYMVLLDESFQGEHLWFLPIEAVSDEEDNQ